MTENELVQLRKKIESLKTSLAVKENDAERLLNDLREHIDIKDMSDIDPILERLKNDLGSLETKAEKLKGKLTELLSGVS